MTPQQDNPTTDSTAAAKQMAEVNVAICGGCGVDVTRTGFIVGTMTYQAFNRSAGKIVRSYKGSSSVRTVHCTLCRTELHIDVEALIAA